MSSLDADVQTTDAHLSSRTQCDSIAQTPQLDSLQVGRETAHGGNIIISLSSAYSGARFLLWAQILLKYYFTAISVLNW